jgi:hypothetical protein
MQENRSFCSICFSVSLAWRSLLPYNAVHSSTFSLKNGVEMYDGDSAGWISEFSGKFWALSDSSNLHTIEPCRSFQWFSTEERAYIVQATSPAEKRWDRWSKECGAGLFIMEPFSEREAKALTSVIIASILFILFDLFSQLNIKSRHQTFPRALQEVGSQRTHLH